MSRPRRSGTGSAFSMFPFLAVLLCTMGAMVVLLVAMAHVARQKAQREADAAAAAIAQERDAEVSEKLREVRAYRARLDGVQNDAAEKLREEQTRLAGIEEHIRRLQDEIEELEAEAIELITLGEAHHEDRDAARQEVARQRELIESLKEEIEQLEQDAAKRERRYAVVPLRDSETGTHRPPVYFECRDEGVVLQPEGLVLGPEDFRPPIEVSSPLGAAVRAINEYYADHPEARAANEAGSPYALLIVRPGGVEAYQMARKVLEAIDVDFGYQPVAEDWPLEYESAKPDLSQSVARAVHLARTEREMLAAAAPQLFQPEGLRAGWEWNQAGGSDRPVGSPDGVAGANVAGIPIAMGASADDADRAPGNRGEGGEGGDASEPAGSDESDALAEERSDRGDEDATGSESSATTIVAAATASGNEEGGAAGQGAAKAGAPTLAQSRGKGGRNKLRDRNRRDGIAIRRTISVVVYGDRLVVLPDDVASSDEAISSVELGDTVPLTGPTRSHAGEITAALRRRAETWGIAGRGFYWKPGVRIHAAADGYRRAEELAVEFDAAGVDVAPIAETASTEGGSDGSRR